MSDQFNSIIANMEPILNQLLASPHLSRTELQNVPKKGIYVFYEHASPIYVGRSNRVRQRLLEHSRPSSQHNSATFAFNLAMEAATQTGVTIPQTTRTKLQTYPPFRKLYSRAKERVAEMKVRVIEITDPIEQTIFEVYAALALGTAYNEFDTH